MFGWHNHNWHSSMTYIINLKSNHVADAIALYMNQIEVIFKHISLCGIQCTTTKFLSMYYFINFSSHKMQFIESFRLINSSVCAVNIKFIIDIATQADAVIAIEIYVSDNSNCTRAKIFRGIWCDNCHWDTMQCGFSAVKVLTVSHGSTQKKTGGKKINEKAEQHNI